VYAYALRSAVAVDGDTILADVDLGFHLRMRMSLRLAGVDTPELTAPDPADRQRAQAARDLVSGRLAAASDVIATTAKPRATDKYGRWLASVRYRLAPTEPWRDLAGDLLAGGLARAYDGGKR
jgi:endonuclease YncB( thermonuclease family)